MTDNKISTPVLIFVFFCSMLILLMIGYSLTNNTNFNGGTSDKVDENANLRHGQQVKPTKLFIVNAASQKDEIEAKSKEYYQAIPVLTAISPGPSLGLDQITINVYESKEEYVKETGKPSWSEGFSDYKNKEVHLMRSEGLVDSILPHELSHLFFDSYIGYEDKDFNWLDEGLATLVQVNYDNEQAASFSGAMVDIRNGKHIPLSSLADYELNQQTPEDQINIYYAQTLSLVDYLISSRSKWQSLLKKLKSGIKFNVALKSSYDKNLEDLENEWQSYIKDNKQGWEN